MEHHIKWTPDRPQAEGVYAIYDKQAGTLLKPFLISRNDVGPTREILEIVTNKDTLIHKHASDFDLMHFAQIDMATMEIEQLEPRLVARCKDLLDDQDTIAR